MFDALIGEEGFAGALVAVPAEPAGPVADAAMPRRRRGPRGPQTDEHKLRAVHGRLKAKEARQRSLLQRPAFSASVVKDVFSVPPDFADQSARRSVEHFRNDVDEVGFWPVDRRSQRSADIARAMVSHLEAQAAGVKTFLESKWPGCHGAAAPRPPLATVWLTIFDDADMWLQRPEGWVERKNKANPRAAHIPTPKLPDKSRKGMQHWGKNVHAPVMNAQETIISTPASGAGFAWRGLDLTTPAVVLPQANFGTILDRLRRWTTMSGSARPGGNIDPGGVINEAVGKDLGCRLVVLMRDAVGVNGCIESVIAAASRESHGTPRAYAVLGLVCLAHQCVLSMRPVLEDLPGVVSNMTRLGHLFSSARFCERFLEKVEVLANEVRVVETHVLPAEATQWRESARQVLEKTRSAQDLDLDAENYILDVLNDDWSRAGRGEMRHFCLHGCKCGQGAAAKTGVFKAFQLLIGRGAPQCLMYRWKNFEKATAWSFRATKCFQILRRGVELVFTRDRIRAAEQEAAAALAAGDVNPAAAQAVRAGKCIDYLRRDMTGVLLNTALVVNAPIQRYLDACFSAEKHAREVISHATAEPVEAVDDASRSPEFDAKVVKASPCAFFPVPRSASSAFASDTRIV